MVSPEPVHGLTTVLGIPLRPECNRHLQGCIVHAYPLPYPKSLRIHVLRILDSRSCGMSMLARCPPASASVVVPALAILLPSSAAGCCNGDAEVRVRSRPSIAPPSPSSSASLRLASVGFSSGPLPNAHARAKDVSHGCARASWKRLAGADVRRTPSTAHYPCDQPRSSAGTTISRRGLCAGVPCFLRDSSYRSCASRWNQGCAYIFPSLSLSPASAASRGFELGRSPHAGRGGGAVYRATSIVCLWLCAQNTDIEPAGKRLAHPLRYPRTTSTSTAIELVLVELLHSSAHAIATPWYRVMSLCWITPQS
ncbi:hypothetical protein B0H19DRAFT_1384552 [Mycena capillaripes]|nr:hypothetical protein B0H19DRAFT_1384552 [Mycena capillaripes]